MHPTLCTALVNPFTRDHPEFFLDLPLMENSQAVIKRLSETYKVFVTSDPMDHPNSFPAKYAWLKRQSPGILASLKASSNRVGKTIAQPVLKPSLK